MTLLLLLLAPVAIGIAAALAGKGRVTTAEFVVQQAAVLLIVGVGYAIALHGREVDTEHWNGRVAKKWEQHGSCCHSYSCNCIKTCTKVGSNESCSEVCQTCYEHDHDKEFYAVTTNDETVFSDTCNRPGSAAPARWSSIRIGEPTTVEHSFTNYVMANRDTILRRSGASDRWAGAVPAYPAVRDLYRADQFLLVGVTSPDAAALNAGLAELNADLGRDRQVNVVVILAAAGDPSYAEAVREAWIGGKKNDLIVVIGAPAFPRIAWAAAVSWSEQEEMKLAIRDRLVSTDSFDGVAVLRVLREEVGSKFVRKRWADFDYLRSTVEPSTAVQTVLLILGIAISIALSVLFYKHDPFNAERNRPWKRRRL